MSVVVGVPSRVGGGGWSVGAGRSVRIAAVRMGFGVGVVSRPAVGARVGASSQP